MKRFFMAGAAAVLLGIAAPAFAADLPTKAPPPLAASLFNWSGFYIGLNAGYAWGNARLIDATGYNGAPPAGNFSYSADGFQGGLHAGWNLQSGPLVFGVEGELGYLDLSGSRQFPPYVGVRTPLDSRASTAGGWYAAIAGRVGFAINTWLIYAKGGVLWADIRNSFIDPDPIGITLIAGTSTTGRSGWLGGLGTEFVVFPGLPSWIARIEWNYYDFGTKSHTTTSTGVPANPIFRHPLTAHSVRLGASAKW